MMKRMALMALIAFTLPAWGQDKVYPTGLTVPKNIDELHRRSWALHGPRLKALPTVTPATWDCRALGLVGPIKDQGGCGSCWNFSAIGIIEPALVKAGFGKADAMFLAEQYVMDCGKNGGCNGDWPETVTDQAKATGLPSLKEYGPYTARDNSPCKNTSAMKFFKIKDAGYVGSSSGVPPTQAIKDAMVAYGPISVAIAADNAFMNSPKGKVFAGSGSRDINHAVVIVGWDDAKGAWILRNSWGTGWCDDGYQWIKYGANQVGYGALWCVAAPNPTPDPSPDPPIPGVVRLTLTPEQVADIAKQIGVTDDMKALQQKLAEIQKILDGIKARTEMPQPMSIAARIDWWEARR